MSRPRHLVAIAGTGTEIGKTWVGCRLLELARARGMRVAVRKPAQSFEAAPALAQEQPGSDGQEPECSEAHGCARAACPAANQPTDADLLAAATGEAPQAICPAHRWYAVPMAPPMAADVLGRERFSVDDLVAEILWPHDVDLGCVEIAGGLRSPIAHDADNVALIERLAPDAVVLVADAGLGTINSVRLSLGALGALGGKRVHVYLNRFDAANELHARNRTWLVDAYGIDVSVAIAELLDRLSR